MTRDDWKKMTPDERRIKIAELCGWTEIKSTNGVIIGIDPDPIERDYRNRIPDYLNDLNAIHEIVTPLTFSQELGFELELDDILEGGPSVEGHRFTVSRILRIDIDF